MSCKEEVIRIGKKLEKMVSSGTQDHASSMDLLNTLKDQPMTLDVLQKTHIGMIVNNFRKASTSDEVISLAKSLIKSWKKLLPADGSGNQSSSSSSRSSSSAMQEDLQAKAEDKAKEAQLDELANLDPSETRFTFEQTSDPVRLKCRSMITQALEVSEASADAAPASHVAAAIEDCVYKEFGSTNMKYKNRIRSRYSNLKDTKNPKLRQMVLTGDIKPEKIAVMTAEEMANEDLKELRKKFTKEAINDHQMAKTEGTKTDLLKCGKCGKRNCTYNQMQTRSADEPMTTFVYCNECGNRWKFC